MSKFEELIKKHETYLITEQPIEGDVPQDMEQGAEQPAPEAPAAPPEPKVFDKPYQDLGQILYKALRMNFEELPEAIQERVHAIAPSGAESIDSDESGSALFGAVEQALSEQQVVPPHQG